MTVGLDWLRDAGFSDATLWVLDPNPRAQRFYEINGWTRDGATKVAPFLGVDVREVRYRRSLA